MKRHKTAHMKRDTENTDRMDKLLGENKRLENLLKSGSNVSITLYRLVPKCVYILGSVVIFVSVLSAFVVKKCESWLVVISCIIL